MLSIPKIPLFRKISTDLNAVALSAKENLYTGVSPIYRAYQTMRTRFRQMTLLRRFMLASFCILILGMVGVGAWVGGQIEAGVVHRTALTTALYVDSFIAEHLQNISPDGKIPDSDVATLKRLLTDTPLGKQIAAFKVWLPDGRIVYSPNPTIIGQSFPVESGLSAALAGKVSARISELDDDENLSERQLRPHLLEIYSPVRKHGGDHIIAVAEFYQFVDGLDEEVNLSRRQTWLVVGAATLLMYFFLAGFVRRASQTITRQQNALNYQIGQLMELLTQNKGLHDRIRRASARSATLQERFLRRISAELHDGPVQEVGLALLKLDSALEQLETGADQKHTELDALQVVKNSIDRALAELRAISSGLGLPELQGLTVAETVQRVVRSHERRTTTHVETCIGVIPENASLPTKITLYRVIQEALTNAFRHGGGISQQVYLSAAGEQFRLKITDQGSGLRCSANLDSREHLGIAGMRERVESLGGIFKIENNPQSGVQVMALLPIQESEGSI